jgi:hypothetical protein
MRAVVAAVAAMTAISIAAPSVDIAEASPGCGRGTLDERQLDAAFRTPGLGATLLQEGFGGADYPHPYALPDGRVLWLFQDMHFSNDEMLGATNAVHNGALIQQGDCWTVQGTQGRDFIGDELTVDGYRWFWPLDGEIAADGNLWIFMADMANGGRQGAALGAAPVSTWVAILHPVTLRQIYLGPAPTDASAALYGWSVTSTDQWSYFTSHCYRQFVNDVVGPGQFDATCMPDTYLGRVPRGRFDLPLQYWNGSGWTARANQATPMMTRGSANPTSMQWFGDVFVNVSKVDEWWGPSIHVDVAAEPQGPWTTVETYNMFFDAKCFMTCGTYGVALLPWLDSNGRMIVSVSHGTDYATWRNNAWLYRPTFLNFDVPASPPGGSGSPPAFTVGADRAGFVAVDPQRLVDTRQAGQPFGRLQPGQTARLDLTALAPPGATAVALNLTSDRASAAGWVRAFPCTAAEPPTSNLNPVVAHVVTNAAIVPLGDGRLCFTTLRATDLIVDLNGWLSPSSTVGLTVVDSRRLLDTRTGQGGAGRLAAGSEVALTVTNDASVEAVALSVTSVTPDGDGFVTAYPCGSARPTVSNLNPVAGQVRPNMVNVRVGTSGRVCLYSLTATDLVVDVVGEYRAGGGARFAALTPQRLLDTRVDGHRRHVGSMADVIPLGGIVAAQANVTVTETASPGYVTIYPCLQDPWPGTSNLNYVAYDTSASAALMVNGRDYGCVMPSSAAEVVVDIFGIWL